MRQEVAVRESLIQKDIIRYLKCAGFYVLKISDRFRSGIPDLYAVRDGRSFWFEVKAPAGKVTKLQQHEIDQLRQHGASAHVVRSVEDVELVIGEPS
jgi:Holliday junction resolvase